jgi:hypothetical protein
VDRDRDIDGQRDRSAKRSRQIGREIGGKRAKKIYYQRETQIERI